MSCTWPGRPKEFGVHSRTAWLPDAFGYSWSLPQILKKAQVDTFVTTKITWSRFTEFPYSVFQWEGADGTRIWGMMPPLNYNGNVHPKDCIMQWNLFKQKERFEELPYPYGHGDGGGGVTMQMIEYGRRLKNIAGVPKCELGRIQDSIDRMKQQCRFEDLPVWNNELYLEYHRGCQTTQEGAFVVLAPNGVPVPHQQTGPNDVLFEVDGLPPMGYAVYRVVRSKPAAESIRRLNASPKGMENDFLRIRFDKDGCLASVYDKVERREARRVAGNLRVRGRRRGERHHRCRQTRRRFARAYRPPI